MDLVSVVMPCHNHGNFLEESIQGILNQRYADLELIIIDDCSGDNTREIIKKYERIDKRVRSVVHETNMGVSRSRNHGIISCNGTYIGFCDADDIWTEDKLEIQIEYLGNNPSYNIIYCDSEIIDENGRPIGQRFSSLYNKTNKRSGNIFAQLCLGNFINTQTVVLNKQCLIDGELFNEHINWGEDWMFWITLARKNCFLYIDEVFAKYRIHSRSTALIHKRGYIEDHLNVRSQVLSKYPDLPSKLSAQILYEIGIAHAQLGEKKAAQKYFLKSLMIDMTNFRALARIFFPKPQSIFYD